jgi:hypothetical protein
MKANKKKIIVLIAMILLLVGTGVLNYFLTAKSKPSDDQPIPTLFETFRADRVTTRDQEISYLDDIIASANSSEEAVASAEAQRLTIIKNMEKELVLEGLIKAKGFADAIVTMSTENVQVVVKDADLTLEDAAQILDIIVTETDFEAPNIIVTPYV